jgi:hypothetical protein
VSLISAILCSSPSLVSVGCLAAVVRYVPRSHSQLNRHMTESATVASDPHEASHHSAARAWRMEASARLKKPARRAVRLTCRT